MKKLIYVFLFILTSTSSMKAHSRDETGSIGAAMLKDYFCLFLGGCHRYEGQNRDTNNSSDVIKNEIQKINNLDLNTANIARHLQKYLSSSDINVLKFAPRTLVDNISKGGQNYLEWKSEDRYIVYGQFHINQIGFAHEVNSLCVKFTNFIHVKNKLGWQHFDEKVEMKSVLCNYYNSLILTTEENIDWTTPL